MIMGRVEISKEIRTESTPSNFGSGIKKYSKHRVYKYAPYCNECGSFELEDVPGCSTNFTKFTCARLLLLWVGLGSCSLATTGLIMAKAFCPEMQTASDPITTRLCATTDSLAILGAVMIIACIIGFIVINQVTKQQGEIQFDAEATWRCKRCGHYVRKTPANPHRYSSSQIPSYAVRSEDKELLEKWESSI
jgi:hypothetical protein